MDDRRRHVRRILKVVLSAFIVYHLATILILPNGSSLMGRKLGRYFIPYANTFALNTAWVFFSPGPAPMYYLEYEVEKGGASTFADPEAESPKYQYPPKRRDLFDDGYNRRLYEMRFFSLNEDRLRQTLVPYLCRQHPEAESITIQSVVERVQDIERAGLDADFKEEGEKNRLPRQTFVCDDFVSRPAADDEPDKTTDDLESVHQPQDAADDQPNRETAGSKP